MKKITAYTASWCGPCKTLKPILKELQSEGFSIDIIDIDENQMESAAKSIQAVPTLILYDDGVEVARTSGVPSKENIKDILS